MRFHKHKLLLDENMPEREHFPRLNEIFDLKHISADLHNGGLPDEHVYALAVKLKRLLVTYNIKDFKPLAQTSKETGIIGVSAHLSLAQVDKKLTSLLTKSTPKGLQGTYTALSETF